MRYCANCGHSFGDYDKACADCNHTTTITLDEAIQYLIRSCHFTGLPVSITKEAKGSSDEASERETINLRDLL